MLFSQTFAKNLILFESRLHGHNTMQFLNFKLRLKSRLFTESCLFKDQSVQQ
jgi:hypothetical protein